MLKKYPVIEQAARRMVAVIPLNSRLGSDFWYWYAFYQQSEYWSAEELLAYQMECLRTLLTNLIETSGFYSNRLSGVEIDRLQTLEQYQSLVPTLSRSDFRSHYPEIRSKAAHEKELSKSGTSGTTGMALQFFHTVKDDQREWAAICHQWKRVGYDPGKSSRAEFRGLTLSGKIMDIFPEKNMLRCSILHLKPEHVRYYAGQIQKNKINFYHGYPSALYLLAVQILNEGIEFPQPEAILLASEIVYDWQVDRIQEAFPTSKIFAHYGCAERTILAGWCEYRREYHCLPQYSLVEVDRETSEIIGTNLFNSTNGFVRYRMTDTVLEAVSTDCPDCGRAYLPRLIRLGGRTEEYLYSPQNGWIPPAIVTYPLKSLTAIQEIQFIQKDPDTLNIKFSVRPNFADRLEDEKKHMEVDLYRLFGNEMKLQYERVDDFVRSPSGKFKWIICELDQLPHH